MMRSTLALLLAATACNPSNPSDACNDLARAWCQHVFDLSNQSCASANAYLTKHSFTSLNDCMAQFTFFNNATCANTTVNACEPNDFSGGRASGCASDIGTLPCGFDFDNEPTDVSDQCGHVCCVHSGNLGTGIQCCAGSSHPEQATGCSLTPPEMICD